MQNKFFMLGNGRYPFKPGSDEFSNYMDFYASEHLSLVSSRLPMNMKPEENHEHDSYEFTIPLSHSPLLSVDNKKIFVKKNTLTSTNPGQLHGPACNMKVNRFMALQINRYFMENISEKMSGKRHVIFDNEPITVPVNLYNLLKEYIIENNFPQSGYKFIIETLSIQIAVNLLRNIKSNISQQKEYNSLSYSKRIKTAIEFMYEYCGGNFTIDDLAREINLSKYHFIRVFKSETGKTPYEYLIEIKIQKAKQLLKKRQHTITEICFLLGFNNHSHFSKIFKKKTGYTPTEFIDRIIT